MSHPTYPRPLADQSQATPPRALFIQRWQTLFTPPHRSRKGWCASFAATRFGPGNLESLFRAGQRGWTIYLIGNEDGVASGRWTDSSWQKFEAELLAHLSHQGVRVKRNYACLDRPGGSGKHDRDSVFRLPGTGIFYHAAQEDGIDLSRSWVIGSGSLELVAGWRAGCNLAAMRTAETPADCTFRQDNLRVTPEHVFGDLPAALDWACRAPARHQRHPA